MVVNRTRMRPGESIHVRLHVICFGQLFFLLSRNSICPDIRSDPTNFWNVRGPMPSDNFGPRKGARGFIGRTGPLG